VLALVGGQRPRHRHHHAIEALARLPAAAALWLCGGVAEGGDRAYEDRLRALAARLGVAGRVSFLGWRDDVPAVLAAADVALLASEEESFGMSLVEAMALGKPCVGTAVGGVPEVIEHGVTGLVAEGDAAALAGALGALVGSPDARAAMGDAGRRRCERLFTVDRQARELAAALDVAIGAGAEARR
jgi:glycosyltransferase involved in cell wall biosynthesis